MSSVKTSRPQIQIMLSSGDRVIEWISLSLLVLLWMWVFYHYKSLPDSIPVHFNAAGQADDYGHKNIIFLIPGIATILFAAMIIANKYPHHFNYPRKITEENALQQYSLATRFMRYLKLMVVLTFFTITALTTQTATGNTNGLSPWFLATILLIFAGVTASYLYSSFRNKS
jgi:uncharacterized membrane protein